MQRLKVHLHIVIINFFTYALRGPRKHIIDGHISEDAKMVVTSLIDWNFQPTFLDGIHNTWIVLQLN